MLQDGMDAGTAKAVFLASTSCCHCRLVSDTQSLHSKSEWMLIRGYCRYPACVQDIYADGKSPVKALDSERRTYIMYFTP